MSQFRDRWPLPLFTFSFNDSLFAMAACSRSNRNSMLWYNIGNKNKQLYSMVDSSAIAYH